MRNLKKVLVLVLCFAMILGLMVVGAGAAFTDQSSIDSKHTEAVDMCVALNIINGMPDGSFNPTGDVTREQMAKMICILDNGGKEPQGSTGNTFSDVAADRWSNKYVESCAARGVVAGVGGGKFDPEGNVTGSQAAKMLLVELGYDQDIAKYTGAGWDTNVNIDATKNGFYKDLEDIDVSAPLSREHAAQMIWNALQASEVAYDYTLVTNPDGSISSVVTVSNKDKYGNELQSLLEDKYGTGDDVFIMTSIEYDADKEEFTYNGEFTTDKDYSDLFGQQVKVVYKDDDVFGIVPEKSSVIAEGVWGDVEAGSSDTKMKIDGEEFKTDSFQNLSVYAFCDGDTADPADYYSIKAIDNNDNNKIDTIVYFPVTVAEVTYVNTTDVRTKTDKFTFEDDDIYSDVQKDDWTVITGETATVNDINKLVKAEEVTGKVVQVKDGGKVRIGDEWYKAADGVTAPKMKEEVTLVVYNGYYFDVSAVTSDLEIAVITDIAAYNNKDKTIGMTLMMNDGSEQEVAVDELFWDDDYSYDAKTINYYVSQPSGSSDWEFIGDFYNYLQGMAVTYEVDKGVYTLTILPTDGKVADTDYESEWLYVEDDEVVYNKDRCSLSIGSYEFDINDDALIVIEKLSIDEEKETISNDGFTFLTGAQLMEKNDYTFGYFMHVVFDKDGAIAAIITCNDVKLSSGDEEYALITAITEKADTGDVETYFTIITKDGKDEVMVASDKNAQVGDVISYTIDDEEGLTVESVEQTVVTAVKSSNATRMQDQDGYRYIYDEDAVIIGIDIDDEDFGDTEFVGVMDAASVPEAQEFYTDANEFDHYQQNVMFVMDGSGDDAKIVAMFVNMAADTEFDAPAMPA